MSETSMTEDKRRVVYLGGPDELEIHVGEDDVTRIDCYEENGQSAPVAWFAVWEGDRLAYRINAAFISEVVYADPLVDAVPCVDCGSIPTRNLVECTDEGLMSFRFQCKCPKRISGPDAEELVKQWNQANIPEADHN